MKLSFLLFLWLSVALVTACADSAAPASSNVRVQATFAAQTSIASGNSGNTLAGLALETDIAATATRQATLDTLADESTRTANDLLIANATSTATRVFATEESARRHETGTATRLLGEQMARAAETSQKRQENYNATKTAEANVTSTWVAASPTRGVEMEQAAAQAKARERAADIAEAEARAKQDTAWLREASFAVLWLVLALIVFGFAFLAAFFLLRFWMMYEQSNRIVEKGNHVIVIESGNIFGGAPQYKRIDQPPAPHIPALTPGELSADSAPATAADAFRSKRMNLAEQPHGYALPIGVTRTGADKWLPLARAGHILIGGPTGFGKTWLVHAMIHALIHRGMTALLLYDGKRGLEFARYASEPHVVVIPDDRLDVALTEALTEMARRYELMLAAGVRDIERYNLTTDDALRRMVVVIDELKDIGAPALAQVVSLMRIGRAAGIHVLLATQFPDAKSIPLDIRGNATTRICFAVADHHQSAAILGSSGAEDLPRIPGRLLLECFGERIEAQAFVVDLPDAPVVTAPPSPFSDMEKKMIQIAISDGGWFKVKRIARALGIDDSTVTATAESWERRGWLSAEKSNVGRPGKNGRQVLPSLLELANRHGIPMSPMSSTSPHVAHVAKSPMSSTI